MGELEAALNLTSGRSVLVTGSAGSLGHAIANEFHRQGWFVTATWHQKPHPFATSEIFQTQLDVTQREAVIETINIHLKRWGRLDALIHSAGIALDALMIHHSVEDWERVLQVHLMGGMNCAKAAFVPMRTQNGGSIIFLGSHAGLRGGAGQVAYATAKAALHGLAQDLAAEGGANNIRVNVVLPGIIDSAMTQMVKPSIRQGWCDANMLKRLNEPEEVAQFVVFICGLKQVSGQIFQLDSRLQPQH